MHNDRVTKLFQGFDVEKNIDYIIHLREKEKA